MPNEKYPDQYLHVQNMRTGEEWIVPLTPRQKLDLTHHVKRWIKSEFQGELRLDGHLTPRIQGDYYGQIITEGRAPTSGVVWESGGFYLTTSD